MARYILNIGEVVEFEAANEFEIFEIIKRRLHINSLDKKETLRDLRNRVISWMTLDIGAQSIRSAIQRMLDQNLIANISSPSSSYNSNVISGWCKTAFSSPVDTGQISRRQFAAIQQVVADIREIANRADTKDVSDALECFFDENRFAGYHFAERYEYRSGTPLPALGLLNYINEFLMKKCEVSSDYVCCHEIFYTQFTTILHKFANFWELTLGLEMKDEFFREGLLLFADFLTYNSNVHHELYTDYSLKTRIPKQANLYFAYGSNMDMLQMRSRCPSAKFVGLSNIKNFEYYIDARGVASLKPKFGATTKGILWDIRDPNDWQNLDYYEGVRHDYYRRHYIQDEDLGADHRCAVYISTTSRVGKPRSNYQEKIVNAVIDLKNQLMKEYDSINNENFSEHGGDWRKFNQSMELWENEMRDWLRE